MELFFEYDIERLRRYALVAENAGKINIESNPNRLFLSFTDVGYFNYCVCREPDQLSEIVGQAQAFYAQHQIAHHKLLIDDLMTTESHDRFLAENGYVLKERLMAVRDPTLKNRPQPLSEILQLEPVSEETIAAFTADYLAGFESEQTQIEPVVINFRQLLGNPNIALFRVKVQTEPVGIAVFYRFEEDYFLAGGSILPRFRNRGYHTAALLTRLNWLNEQHARSITSWAYDGGASYRNMLRVGLMPYKCYRVYGR
ncbi:hypothetical protein [Larkinella rosea]|uniref:N-acetyltransferase domain-containing protein n=1 Tax=Larkinella rosea TaxID=2025312 RepID=A0A3P1BU13_9BACT|nr:hypothetical protein [Larkinella rosea]RRB04024.1 hypothetical protein EHT25_10880 [Larkinella rosea]